MPWKCATYYPVEESYGCSILSAFAVRYLRSLGTRKAIHFEALLGHVSPWHCLVCCRGYGEGDLPSRVFGYWREFILEVEKAILGELPPGVCQELNDELNNYRGIYNQIEPTEEPPSYVLSLLNNELEEQPDPNLRTLTVFRERNEPM